MAHIYTSEDLPMLTDEMSRCENMALEVLNDKTFTYAGSGITSTRVAEAFKMLSTQLSAALTAEPAETKELKLEVARLKQKLADLKKPLIDLGFAETGQGVITYKNGSSLWYGWPSVVHTIVNSANYDKGESDEPAR